MEKVKEVKTYELDMDIASIFLVAMCVGAVISLMFKSI